LFVAPSWSPGAVPKSDALELLRAYAQRQEKVIAASAAEADWPDEGLRHPPLRNVKTVHVRLHQIGSLPARFAYDPDRE
jgi:hypothetical protein